MNAFLSRISIFAALTLASVSFAACSGDDNAKRDSLARLYNASFSEFIAACRDFIKENPDNIACAYAFTVLNSEQCSEDYRLVGENVKNSPVGQVIEYYYGQAKEGIALEEAAAKLEEGRPAPSRIEAIPRGKRGRQGDRRPQSHRLRRRQMNF